MLALEGAAAAAAAARGGEPAALGALRDRVAALRVAVIGGAWESEHLRALADAQDRLARAPRGGGGGGGDDDDDDDFLVPLTVHGELPDSLGCCSSSTYGAGQHCGGSTMIG